MRYDFVKDIKRLENMVCGSGNVAVLGYAILLANEQCCWKLDARNARETKDEEFRVHEGRKLAGALRWRGTPSGTTKNRESELRLDGSYQCEWADYHEFRGQQNGSFRYLLIAIGRDAVRGAC